MLKVVAIITVPSALAGAGLFYGSPETSIGPEPQLGAYVVQVGLAFPERAVRAALPRGLEPTPGFTGGIAIYQGEEDQGLSALSAGYVWIDVLEQTDGRGARYIVRGLPSEDAQETTAVAHSLAAPVEAHLLDQDGVLQVLARPDQVSELELVVRPISGTCTEGLAANSELLALGSDKDFRAVPISAIHDWCEVEAEAAWVSVNAPFGHALRPLVPQQILWAEFATPTGELTAE